MIKLIAALKSAGGKGLTTIEINERCQTTRASSDISELRQNGVEVQVDFNGTSQNGRKVYRYSLWQPQDDMAQTTNP